MTAGQTIDEQLTSRIGADEAGTYLVYPATQFTWDPKTLSYTTEVVDVRLDLDLNTGGVSVRNVRPEAYLTTLPHDQLEAARRIFNLL